MNLSTTLSLYCNRLLQGRTEFQGLSISVENKVGSIREGVDDGGKKWKTVFKYPYGYIKGFDGVDGDDLDCFIGPNPDAESVYVIHTKRPPKFTAYDEDKVMLGWDSAEAAKRAYLQHYNNPKFFQGMDTLTMDEFRKELSRTKDNPQKIAAMSLR